jgi:2',3'-cyclic-nucleotide 2'-phosphodiesterase (5'-nucleotidase family)
VVVDAGDWSGAAPHENVKGPFFMDAMQLLGYDAATVGEREFNYGYKLFLDQAAKRKLTIVQANLRDKATGKLLWKPYIIKTKMGFKVAIVGLISRTVPLGPAQDSTIVDDPLVVAQKLIPELRKKAQVVILLAHMGRVDAEDLATQVPGIDVLVVGHHPGLVLSSRKMSNTISVASGEQGQNVGETYLDCDAGKCTPREGKVTILMPEVGERADIAKLAKELEDGVNAAQKKDQQKTALANTTVNPAEPHYLGQDACVSCHQPQAEQWRTTAHAHAFDVLVKQSKDATPECVQCHVTGWAKTGGFVSQASTGSLINVQCEVCHGMGTQHDMFSAKAIAPPESLCVSCHNPVNDPSWNYAAKLPKVTH